MPRYRLDCAYHGAAFHGWQRQPGLRTVQGTLEEWLGRLCAGGERVAVTGAGRTDAGVHASGMVAHFDLSDPCDPTELAARMRAALPGDLIVQRIAAADSDFHARYSATSRTYEYGIATTPTPFARDRLWHLRRPLDCPQLQSAAGEILGAHDFAGFCRAESRKENNRCTVSVSEWHESPGRLTYRISADRFLHEMVRLIVGTSVAIGLGRFGPERIGQIRDTGDVRLCGDAAPAHGLTLVSVGYDSA